jgi:hypothetical protein
MESLIEAEGDDRAVKKRREIKYMTEQIKCNIRSFKICLLFVDSVATVLE